jgi:thiol-disulfide isomerase/thioredoxin
VSALFLAAALLAGPAAPAPRGVTLQPLDAKGLATLRANATRHLRIVSVWATWCGPCVVELPDIVALEREWRGSGVEVVTISADPMDRRDDVLALLRRREAQTTNYIFGDEGPDLATTLDAGWDGGLPFTLLLAPGGRVLVKSQGTLEIDALRSGIREWVRSHAHPR